jgi:signal transduction histidine kinase
MVICHEHTANHQVVNPFLNPFERLGVEDSDIEGTGIVLTITKKLMDLMNGNIFLKSPNRKRKPVHH